MNQKLEVFKSESMINLLDLQVQLSDHHLDKMLVKLQKDQPLVMGNLLLQVLILKILVHLDLSTITQKDHKEILPQVELQDQLISLIQEALDHLEQLLMEQLLMEQLLMEQLEQYMEPLKLQELMELHILHLESQLLKVVELHMELAVSLDQEQVGL
jgi:hypothetical protein